MAKLIVSLGLLLFLLPIPLLAEAGPMIHFDALEHDFGDVMPGESPSVDLTCRNTGDAVLVLARIESSCGCAKAIRGGASVAPGSEGKIYAQIETVGMRPGPHVKTIAVHSNDPEHPRITLKLRFNVVRHVSLVPDVLAARLPEENRNAAFSLTAMNHSANTITLKAAPPDGPDEVALVPEEVVVPAGGKIDFQLTVRVKRPQSQPFVKGRALIETTDPRERTVPVPYFIRFSGKGAS